MISRAELLALKRRSLQLSAELQRQEIARLSHNVEARLSGADRLADIVSSTVKSPLLLAGIFAGSMLIGRWRIVKWASQGAMLFNVVRVARKFLGK